MPNIDPLFDDLFNLTSREMIDNDVSLEAWIIEQLSELNFDCVAPNSLIVHPPSRVSLDEN